MLSFLALSTAFLLGGVTLLPLVLAVFAGVVFYTSPVVHLPPKTGLPNVATTNDEDAELVSVYRAGWLMIRRTYEPLLETNGTYMGMMVSGYRSFMDNRSRDPRRAKPKDRFFAVLKQNILFLYDTEEHLDCWAAINVSSHEVLVYPEGNLDGELFVKRNALCLKPTSVTEGDVALESHTASPEKTHNMDPTQPLPWFIFARVNSDKEDWYHSLVLASKLGKPDTSTTMERDRSLFDPEDMAALIDGIDQQPDSIPMRWFNALIGRVFLAVYRTSTLEEYITSRIVRKLKRVKTPSMLSEIKVREVNVGSAAPHFSKPMLKELTAEGDASMEVHVSYIGDLRITIETVATINLGSRFKPYSVRIVLAVVLKELEGTMLLKVKRPPSNRIWFGFTTMPRMVLNVEPVVSTRQIKWSLITNPIASRIREVIQESLVLPHMDDVSFFNSRPFHSRGGIWGDALRTERNLDPPSVDAEGVAAVASEEIEGEGPGELIPGISDNDEHEAASTSAKGGGSGSARLRHGRAQTVGDHPNAPQLNAVQMAATLPKRSDSSSTLSSFSLSSWREARALKEGSTGPGAGAGAGDKRRAWFGSSRAGTMDTTSAKPPSNSSQSSLVSTTTVDTPVVHDAHGDHSARRLRDVLTKRAHSREREKAQKKERRRSAASSLEDELVALVTKKADPTPSETSSAPVLSALSLTAPGDASDGHRLSASPSSSIASEQLPPSTVESAPSLSTTSSFTDGSGSLLPKPLTDSPEASREHLPQSMPDSGLSHTPITSAAPLEEDVISTLPASTTSTAQPPPPVPSRPSFTKDPPAVPPPPPRRHQPSQSVDANSTYGAASLLSSWRTKAADKQAIAAGVAQAKESMKRWGATWNTRRTGGAEDDAATPGESPAQDMGRTVPAADCNTSPTRGGLATPPGESYRDYRASKSRNGDYFGATDSGPSTPPLPISMGKSGAAVGERSRESSHASPGTSPNGRNARASLSSSPSGHFTPAASSPTVKLSTAPMFATGAPSPAVATRSSPTKPPVLPTRAYKPATMMSIPGIRDESHRKAVASDHVSAAELAKEASSTPAESSSLTGAEKIAASKAISSTGSEAAADQRPPVPAPAKPPANTSSPARPVPAPPLPPRDAAAPSSAATSAPDRPAEPPLPAWIRKKEHAKEQQATATPDIMSGATQIETRVTGQPATNSDAENEEVVDVDEWGLNVDELNEGNEAQDAAL